MQSLLNRVCPLQVVQPDLEEVGGLQGAGERTHLCGDCREDAGEGLRLPCPGALQDARAAWRRKGTTTPTARPLSVQMAGGRVCPGSRRAFTGAIGLEDGPDALAGLEAPWAQSCPLCGRQPAECYRRWRKESVLSSSAVGPS